jgi:hypothetical protein
MSYEIKPLRGPIGLSTDTDPLVYETGLQASEMALLNFVFKIDAVSGGIGALSPAVFVCEHSWDAGATWTVIPSMVLEDITAAGTFRAYASNATGLIAPNVRVSVSCPAGEEVVIGSAQRVHVSPRDSAFLSPPSIPGGVATEATLLDILFDTTAILSDTNTLAAKDFATQTTLASVLADTNALVAKDFATQTTLASVLSDTNSLVAKDFATQTTSAAILAELQAPVGTVRQPILPYVFRDYSSSAITNAAYFQVVASTAAAVFKLHIFDSSGEPIILALGDAGSEVDSFLIEPGGSGAVEISIPVGTRLSVKSAGAAAVNDGLLIINLLD